jgi:hypothetical protein
MAPVGRFIGAGTRAACALSAAAAPQATADDACLSSAIEALAPPHTCDRTPLAAFVTTRARAHMPTCLAHSQTRRQNASGGSGPALAWSAANFRLSALHCTALHCTALHCTALHCTAPHRTALHCTALQAWLRLPRLSSRCSTTSARASPHAAASRPEPGHAPSPRGRAAAHRRSRWRQCTRQRRRWCMARGPRCTRRTRLRSAWARSTFFAESQRCARPPSSPTPPNRRPQLVIGCYSTCLPPPSPPSPLLRSLRLTHNHPSVPSPCLAHLALRRTRTPAHAWPVPLPRHYA